jgi:hypothetical protein
MMSKPTTAGARGSDTHGEDQVLNPEILQRLEAGAFRQLCKHLQERSDLVSNIDLMTLSGFCRNCLAKVRLAYRDPLS